MKRSDLSFAAAGLAAVFATVTVSSPAQAQLVVEAGTGWQDTGAAQYALHWLPAIWGSRKDVPAYVGVRRLGTQRVYWAAYARLNYTNYWSIGGGGNSLGVSLAPAGLGVYLSRPLADVPETDRRGRWFATMELVPNVQFGGNITPSQPANADIPDPDAYRARLRATTDANRSSTVISQHYPGGDYRFATVSMPLQIRAWNMVQPRTGVGFFMDVDLPMFEWNLLPGASLAPAYAYHITAGLSVILL